METDGTTKANPRILIVLMGSLGDVVRGLSILPRLKAWRPQARITWVVEPKSKEILTGHPAISRLLVFERSAGLSGIRNLIRELHQESYDIALDLQRHLKSGIVTRLSRAPRRIGFHRNDSKEGNWLFQTETIPYFGVARPKIEAYHAFADLLSAPPATFLADGLSHISLTPELVSGPYIAFVLGSSWNSKDWLASGYQALAQKIVDRLKHQIVLLGGPKDSAVAELIAKIIPENRLTSLVGETSLQQLAAVIRGASICVGPDSGPAHIAASFQTPYVTLFGPTDPVRVGAYGMQDLVVRSAIGCSPCEKRECPGLGKLCMRLIDPARVFEVVQGVVESQS